MRHSPGHVVVSSLHCAALAHVHQQLVFTKIDFSTVEVVHVHSMNGWSRHRHRETILELDREEKAAVMSDIVQGGIEKIGSRAAVQGVQISRSTDMHADQHPSQARVLDAADVTVLVDVQAAMTVVAELLRDALDTAGADGQVNVDVAVSDDHVEVLIESSGEPIAASRVDAVFVPFDRTRGPGLPPARPPALSLPHARLMARVIGGDVTAVPHESRRALVFTLPVSA